MRTLCRQSRKVFPSACLLLMLWAVSAGQAPKPAEGRVVGVLREASQPAPGKWVVLVEVRLVDFTGREVRALPPSSSVIVDADPTKPRSVTRTDASGSFTFTAVPPGRYAVGVTSKAKAPYAQGDVILLERAMAGFSPHVFDVGPGQEVRLGDLVPRKK